MTAPGQLIIHSEYVCISQARTNLRFYFILNTPDTEKKNIKSSFISPYVDKINKINKILDMR